MQELFHFHCIRTPLPQHSGGLKGAFTGSDVEALCIQENTRHQALGFNGQNIALFHCVLQQLRYQFRCRGRKGLVEVYHHRVDIIRGSAVMIHHTDLGNGLQEWRALHLIWTVGIHHNQGAVVIAQQKGFLAGDKCFPVFRYDADLFQKFFRHIPVQIQNDIGLFALFAAHTGNTHGRTHGIQVSIFVSHDEHLTTLTDKLHQGVGRNTGTHFAAVVVFFVAAAVEGEVKAILDDRLVTAAAQRHFNGQCREIVAFLKIRTVHADAQGNGHRQTGGILHLMDFFQQGELFLSRPFQILFFKHQQEAVALQPTKQAMVGFCPGGDDLIDPGVQVGNATFCQVFNKLLVVVHQNDADHRAGSDIFVPYQIQLCQIAEIQHTQRRSFRVICPESCAVYPIAAAGNGDIVGILRLAGSQPVQPKTGQNTL